MWTKSLKNKFTSKHFGIHADFYCICLRNEHSCMADKAVYTDSAALWSSCLQVHSAGMKGLSLVHIHPEIIRWKKIASLHISDSFSVSEPEQKVEIHKDERKGRRVNAAQATLDVQRGEFQTLEDTSPSWTRCLFFPPWKTKASFQHYPCLVWVLWPFNGSFHLTAPGFTASHTKAPLCEDMSR